MELPSEIRTKQLRRIVTGHNAAGRSLVAFEGLPSPILEFAPGAGLYEIWTDVKESAETSWVSQAKLLPPEGGIKCRWFTVLPEPPDVKAEELAAFYDAAFRAMADHDVRPDTSRHPGMHRTETLDFIIVIEGQVRLILDEEERLLQPGDAVVQRATNHAWRCVGDTPALLVAVLIDKTKRRDASQSVP